MKSLFKRVLIIFSLLIFHCDTNELTLDKTTIVTYLGNGDVIVESIFRTIPNIPIRIMTDGIMTPNYLYVLNASINGQPIDTSKFEFNYQKTEKGNFKYISLKNAYYKNSFDSIFILYKTNILTSYQQNLKPGRYIFEFKMAEIIPQTTPEVNVKSVLMTKSETALYLPRVLFFNNYKLSESDDKGNLKYSRNYLCTSFGELLFLLYPKFVFQLNNLRSVGQYDHWINLEDLHLVEEGFRLNFRQIDSTIGMGFSLPFKKEIAHPDINLILSGNNIVPFPIDSASFDSILHSVSSQPNEAFYYIGPTSGTYDNKTHYLLNIIFSMHNKEIGSLELKYKYTSKNILHKINYFESEIHIEPIYLPAISALNKLEISIPEYFTFFEDDSYANHLYSIGEHSIIFKDVNKPEFFSNPLVLHIIKDGYSFFNTIKVINILFFIISLLIMLFDYFKIISLNFKKFPTITEIILFILNLFLVGFSKEENIFALFFFVWGFLPLVAAILIFLYNSRLSRKIL